MFPHVVSSKKHELSISQEFFESALSGTYYQSLRSSEVFFVLSLSAFQVLVEWGRIEWKRKTSPRCLSTYTAHRSFCFKVKGSHPPHFALFFSLSLLRARRATHANL
jgi:hypothetical protein